MKEQANLTGSIEKITYKSPSGDFTVAELNDGDCLMTVVGSLCGAGVGETVRLSGYYDDHPTFGVQFRAESCERLVPNTAASILKYLSGGGIKGVGPATAMRIVSRFGDETLAIIEKSPERLAEIKGISRSKAMAISEEFLKQFGVRDLMIYLAQYEVSPDESLKIYKLLGAAALEKIKLNPYYTCSDEIGFSFERADAIATGMGYGTDFDYRIMCGAEYVLRHNVQNGHTCIPYDKAVSVAAELLGVNGDRVSEACEKMLEQKRLISEVIGDKRFLFLPYQYKAERYISDRLRVMLHSAPPTPIDVKRSITEIEKALDISFGELQYKAIEAAVEKGVLILTGGPGTGKTTTLNAIIRLMETAGFTIALAAPTGRAAKRMTEVTGYEAKTVHRLLEVEWDDSHRPFFSRNERNPLSCHVLIVDEMSMVDSVMFESLLRAVPFGCRLVLVGDSDQLPSVGAGNVIHDLIDSGIVPTVELTEIFRQAMQSAIVTNSHLILEGTMPDLAKRDSDFFFLRSSSARATAQTVCELATARLPKAYGYNTLDQIQILCPSRKREAGTFAINNAMQQILNPRDAKKNEISFGHYVLREGDKVMQIKNNYDIAWTKEDGTDGMGVYNGDVGVLEIIDRRNDIMKIRFDDRTAEYLIACADQLELAYAVTVHKSQGSEYDCVVMPVSDMPVQLRYRNLLYTGVTRAKKLLVLVGSEQTVKEMTDNVKRTRRYTALRSFLES